MPLKNLFSKIGNGQVVENLFPEQMIYEISESHHFFKFDKKRYEKKALANKICKIHCFSMFQTFS